MWFPNFKIGWEIIGGKYIVRISSVFFCDFLPGQLYVEGTLLNCYPDSSSFVLGLTSRKTLFSNIVKRKFSSWIKEVESQGLFSLAFDFFLALSMNEILILSMWKVMIVHTQCSVLVQYFRWDPAVMILMLVTQTVRMALQFGMQTLCVGYILGTVTGNHLSCDVLGRR